MQTALPIAQLALAAFVCASASAPAFSSEKADPYTAVQDGDLKDSFVEMLASEGVSSTGKLVSFHRPAVRSERPDEQVYVHVIQDRGLPTGAEYPTFVFKTVGGLDRPLLLYKTSAGTRLYTHPEGLPVSGCLISAEKGYSDVCLADVEGNPAQELPGLRKDFWSDLIKLFGL